MSVICDSWRPTDRKQSIPASVPCVKFQTFSFNKTYNHSCNAYNRAVAHQVRFRHNWYRLKKCTCPYDTHRLQMKCQQTLFDRWQLVNVIYKVDNIRRYRGPCEVDAVPLVSVIKWPWLPATGGQPRSFHYTKRCLSIINDKHGGPRV